MNKKTKVLVANIVIVGGFFTLVGIGSMFEGYNAKQDYKTTLIEGKQIYDNCVLANGKQTCDAMVTETIRKDSDSEIVFRDAGIIE